jgi:quercetin dioxygenase-like cupin family protein
MPLVRSASAALHTTPNAVMRTLAAPSVGSTELAVWEVTMTAGQAGPPHRVDHEQVWVLVEGALSVHVGAEILQVSAGDAAILRADDERRVVADGNVRALVSSVAAPRVHTPDGGDRPLPWAV